MPNAYCFSVVFFFIHHHAFSMFLILKICMIMVRCCEWCPSFRRRNSKKIVLLLVGLDNAGKTTAARGLAGGITDDVIPTVGFSSIKLKHRGMDVFIYDLGGGPQIRAIWKSYFSDVHGVIFVVDASDASRIEECKYVLENLLKDERLAGKPVLVLANKQDRPGALDQVDLVESLKLEPLVNEQKCLTLLEECSAINYANKNKNDPRILHGYRWLLNQIENDYNVLNPRVEFDKKKETEKFEARRNELRQRLAGNIENGYSGIDSFPNGDSDRIHYGDRIIQVSPPPVINGSSDCYKDYGLSDNNTNHVNDITRHVREQLQRQSAKEARKGSGMKKNKIVPLEVYEQINNNKAGPSCSSEIPMNNFDNDNSLMVQALTSPFMKKRNFKQRLPPLRIPGALRPPTSKSLGHEGTAWDLDKDLEIVDPLRLENSSEISKVRGFNEIEAS